MSSWTLPLIGLAASATVMTLAWLRQRRTSNAGLVDVLWAVSIGVLAVTYAISTDGWGPRRALLAALAGLWSARLSGMLALRVSREPEDGRYAALRRAWGPHFHPRIFWFFQAQGALAVLLSLAFLIPMQATAEGWHPRDVVAVGLWVTAQLGQASADRQLHAWRSNPANRGRTCRAGLWAHSRHPNYFFEWIHWLAYPVLAWSLPLGWVVWFAPALMLFLVLRVTGIPPTERQALATRGDDYRRYQATTNAFFPGPRRASVGLENAL